MKLRIIFPVLAVLALIIASCSSAATEPAFVPTILAEENTPVPQDGPPVTEAEIPRVTVEEMLAAIESDEAVIVDVRSAEAYQSSHIPGSLSIPLAQIETNPAGVGLEMDQWIVTYCT